MRLARQAAPGKLGRECVCSFVRAGGQARPAAIANAKACSWILRTGEQARWRKSGQARLRNGGGRFVRDEINFGGAGPRRPVPDTSRYVCFTSDAPSSSVVPYDADKACLNSQSTMALAPSDLLRICTTSAASPFPFPFHKLTVPVSRSRLLYLPWALPRGLPGA